MEKQTTRSKGFGKGDWKAFFKLIPQIKLPWLLILIGFLINFFDSEIRARVPVSTSELFGGTFTGEALTSALLYQIFSFVLIIVGIFAISFVNSVATLRSRKILWDRMLHTRMAYYDRHDPSNVMSIVTNDVEIAVNAIVGLLISTIPTLYLVWRTFSTVGNYDMRLMASVMVVIPLNVVISIVVGRWRYETNDGINRQIGTLTGFLAERVANIPLIHSYTNEKKEAVNGEIVAKGLYKAKLRSAKVTFAADTMNGVMDIVQRSVSILFGVMLMGNGDITQKQWIAFFLYVNLLIPKINDLVSVWTSIKSAQGSAARVISVLEAPLEHAEKEGIKPEHGDIVFDHVSFSYAEDKPALRDVTVTIPAGRATAIVGRCGSGKTTMISLLERLYTPDDGNITMGGVDIGKTNLTDYRDHFAYVQQDAGIFSGNLRSVVTYGIKQPMDDNTIMAAAEKAGSAALIQATEHGLDGELAIAGRSVSGGQRQRLVLTRELMKNRDVLLLDEPTSALDAQTARDVQKTIFEQFAGKTLVMITHDLRLLDKVDQIIVMDQGEMVGCGTHSALMRSCPAYQSLIACAEGEGDAA